MEQTPKVSELSAQKNVETSKLSREMIYLAEQAKEGILAVFPGEEWSLHYPVDQTVRNERLQGLLEGRYTAKEVAHDIAPDALIYNAHDIETEGLERVSGRIRDLSSFITYYDYTRFAHFIENLRGLDIPIDQLDKLYSQIAQSRIQKKLMDVYGYTGRTQIAGALRTEVEDTIANINHASRSQKILKALKTNWLYEDVGLVSMEERDSVLAKLSGDERELYEDLQTAYRTYVQSGSEEAYQKIINAVQQGFSKISQQTPNDEPSQSMQQLDEELEQFLEQATAPGTPEDPGIPPDDQDEYHTPPPHSGETKENMPESPIFEIIPALAGYYISGRKSYFDIESKTWSKKKRLSPYQGSVEGEKCYTISGRLNAGLKSLPIPNGYAVDLASFKFSGDHANFFRDQNGCFYLESFAEATFSVDFLEEAKPFINPPIPEDMASLYQGSLSEKTERTISRLNGTPIQKAEQVRQHILANHFYPGGGDLQKAQALQYKLRSESTGENYLQNIDVSEYLECYSANTKFIAMMRKVNIPARLVTGHRVNKTNQGKSTISQETGHAWSEIWDGQTWRGYDATPNPKPEDQKATQTDDQKLDKEQSRSSSIEPENPLNQLSQASDSDIEQSESQLKQAREQLQKMLEQKQQFVVNLSGTHQFKDISRLQEAVEKSDLLDDFKEEIQEKIKAKEDQMKQEIGDKIERMTDDGFMDEAERDKILSDLEEKGNETLDAIQEEIEEKNQLYQEYEDIVQEVNPLVDEWFEYFAQRLPKVDEVGFDEDSLTRQGIFNRQAVMKPRNLLFGMIKNPREIRPSTQPKFLASILIDVSGSMQGKKLIDARKLLIFYSELFNRISQVYGYIRFSIATFSDSVTSLKDFGQDYGSPQRYDFEDGTRSTIKIRIMQGLTAKGGTNILQGVEKVSADLNQETQNYPDYASAFYFVGDGEDSYGNSTRIKEFLRMSNSEHGFGEHMFSAIMLAKALWRNDLAEIFGEEHTSVAPNLDELIRISMEKFDEDLEEYLKTKSH